MDRETAATLARTMTRAELHRQRDLFDAVEPDDNAEARSLIEALATLDEAIRLQGRSA